MNDIVEKQDSLPAELTNMASGLAASVASAGAGGGSDLFCKMTRNGEFVFGAEDTEFQEGSLWAVNPGGLQHGWIAWGDAANDTEGQMLGERMGPAAQPLTLQTDLPEVKGSWAQCVAVQLRCTNGDDKGVQVVYKTSSLGGRKGYAALLSQIVARIQEGKLDFVAVVECLSTSYKHAKFGKIYTPDFKVRDWMTMEGVTAEEPAAIEDAASQGLEVPEPEPEPEPEQPKRRRRAA